MKQEHSNELINETSPYLIQHAHNPVHWKPWTPKTLDLAKASNKLMLISIGYSAIGAMLWSARVLKTTRLHNL